MYRSRSVMMGIIAVGLTVISASSAAAQSGPVGDGPATNPAQPPKRTMFTYDSVPDMLKQLGYSVTEKSFTNGRVYWQIATKADGWYFTVRVVPMGQQGAINALDLTTDLGHKVNPQASTGALLKLLQAN